MDNESGKAAPVTVVTSVVDARGRVVARAESDAAVTDHATVSDVLRVQHPDLWSTDSPAALHAAHRGAAVGRTVLDRYDTRFGFR